MGAHFSLSSGILPWIGEVLSVLQDRAWSSLSYRTGLGPGTWLQLIKFYPQLPQQYNPQWTVKALNVLISGKYLAYCLLILYM